MVTSQAHDDSTRRRLFFFALIGGVGFCVDAGVLQILFLLGSPPLYARAVSFPLAVTATWLLNRRYTFANRPTRGGSSRYALYVLGQICGGLLNLGVFATTIKLAPTFSHYPVIPLGIGSGVAMVFNYVWANTVVFDGPPLAKQQKPGSR